MAAVIPWWKTPWVAVPIFGASAAAGVTVAALTRREDAAPPRRCPGAGVDGGVVEGIEYAEFRSAGGSPEETLPMLVVLHGRGMTGSQMGALATALPVKARIVSPLGMHPSDDGGFQWADPTGVVPLHEDAGVLYNFLEEVRRCRPTIGKPVVAGYDEGAEVAYLIAADEPNLVSGVVGAAGRPHLDLGAVRAPTVALHGMADEVLPHTEVQDAWRTMVSEGAPVRFIRMFGVGHSFAGALQIKLWQEASRLLAIADPSRESGTQTPSG